VYVDAHADNLVFKTILMGLNDINIVGTLLDTTNGHCLKLVIN